MPLLFFFRQRTINKKVTIHGSSGSPEKGNLNKHIHNDATASYNNVKNYALHTTPASSPQTRGSCQPLFQTSKSNSSILAEKPLDKNLRCRQRNHLLDTSRFNVVPTDTIPTYHASSHDAPAWFSTRQDGRRSLARSACS